MTAIQLEPLIIRRFETLAKRFYKDLFGNRYTSIGAAYAAKPLIVLDNAWPSFPLRKFQNACRHKLKR
jgi:hypothetical protein